MTSGSTIDRELRSDERLLWKGRPIQGLRLRAVDWYLIPISILWGGFAIFWEFTALTIPKQDASAFFFPLFGVPFVLLGLYFIFGRFFVDARMRANTEYAVTTQRAIITTCLLSKSVKSLNLKSVPDISFSESGSGIGTITFGQTSNPFYASRSFAWPGMTYGQPPSFDLIDGARSVYETVLKVQNG
jgi:hypothetical protein